MRLSTTEWKAMEVVWRLGRARARDVHDALGEETGWAYTTVKTILGRLADKGVLTGVKDGRSVVYTSAVSRAEARGSAVRHLVDRAFGGTVAPLLHFLVEQRELTGDERDELRRLLAESERGSESP